jgi:hypothetical protein
VKLSLGKDNPHEAPEAHFTCPVPQETKPDGKRRTVIQGLHDSLGAARESIQIVRMIEGSLQMKVRLGSF